MNFCFSDIFLLVFAMIGLSFLATIVPKAPRYKRLISSGARINFWFLALLAA